MLFHVTHDAFIRYQFVRFACGYVQFSHEVTLCLFFSSIAKQLKKNLF